MSIPRYRTGERVRFLAEGAVAYVRHAPCEAPHPGALTIAVPLEGGGTYDVTVPLGAVTIERLAPEADAPRPEADEPREPRPMLGDVWEDGDDDEWEVVEAAESGGGLQLRYRSLLLTWAQVNRRYGPLTLIERAGYRRTEAVISAGRLRSGQVVSCPDWCDGAPVRLLTVQALNADGETEVTYEPLGDDAVGTGTAAPDVRTTLWFGRAVDRG